MITAHVLVDTGIQRLEEMTPQSVHKLKLVKGDPVWCLFKAQALVTI